jgi:hypothetical protein
MIQWRWDVKELEGSMASTYQRGKESHRDSEEADSPPIHL